MSLSSCCSLYYAVCIGKEAMTEWKLTDICIGGNIRFFRGNKELEISHEPTTKTSQFQRNKTGDPMIIDLKNREQIKSQYIPWLNIAPTSISHVLFSCSFSLGAPATHAQLHTKLRWKVYVMKIGVPMENPPIKLASQQVNLGSSAGIRLLWYHS